MNEPTAGPGRLGALRERLRGAVRDLHLPDALTWRMVFTSLGVGAVAGMATFVYIQDALVPGWYEHWWALLVIAAAGGYTHVFSRNLEESVAAALLGQFVGLGVHLGSYVSPLSVLEDPPTPEEFFWYDPRVQDMLLANLLGRASTTAILTYFMAFMSGYLLVVSIYGYFLD